MGCGLCRVGEKVFWTHTPALKKEWVKAERLGREAGREKEDGPDKERQRGRRGRRKVREAGMARLQSKGGGP